MVLQCLRFRVTWVEYLFVRQGFAVVGNMLQNSMQSALKCSSVPEMEKTKTTTTKNYKYLLPSATVRNVANGKNCISFNLFIISVTLKIRN